MTTSRQHAVAFATLLWPGLLWSQYVPDSAARKVRVFDAFAANGPLLERQNALGLEQWRSFATGSQILQDDLSGYEQVLESGDPYPGAMGVNYSITLGYAPSPARPRPGIVLRAGADFQHHPTGSLELTRTERTPFDTLTSSQTGQITVIDSVVTSTYSMEHSYDQIGLDVSLLWLKEYPRHWSLYAGAGVILGYTFGGNITVSHSITEGIDPALPPDPYDDDANESVVELESIRTEDEAYVALHLPMGFGYRLGWKRAFWRALNLGLEFRPAVFYGGAPELDRGVRIGSQFLFALRVDLLGGAGLEQAADTR